MRHRLQSRQVVVGIALAVLESVALGAVAVLAFTGPLPAEIPARHAALFSHHVALAAPATTVGGSDLLVGAGVLFALLCFQIAAMLLLNGLFHRTAAGEAFFLVSYVISLAPEVARLVCAVLVFRGYAPALTVLATRVVYMGRLFGLASLFFAILCTLGMRYADYAVLSGASLLLSLAMGAVVPVDSSSLTTGLVHAVSDGGGLLSVGATATVIVALGAIGAPLVRQERRFVGYAAGVVCLLVARELLSIGMVGAAVGGIALFVGGTSVASRSLERVYLGIS